MSRRFRVCLVLTAPLLLVAMGEMVVGPQAITRLFPWGSLGWVQLALATPVVLWGGRAVLRTRLGLAGPSPASTCSR